MTHVAYKTTRMHMTSAEENAAHDHTTQSVTQIPEAVIQHGQNVGNEER